MNRILKPLYNWQGWTFPTFCLLLSGSVLALVWGKINFKYSYNQFIVGRITWVDESKADDFWVFYLFIGLTFVFYLGLQSTIAKMSETDDEFVQKARNLILLTFLPLAFWFGSYLVDPHRAGKPIEWLLGALILIFLLVWYRKRSTDIDPETFYRAGVLLFLIAFIGLFIGLACLLLVSLIVADPLPKKTLDSYVIGGSVLALLPAFLVMLFKKNIEILCCFLHRYLFVIQLPLPILFLAVLPSRLLYKGEIQPYNVSLLLSVALGGGMVAAWIVLWRQGSKSWGKDMLELPLSKILCPGSIVAIAVFIGTRDFISFPTFFSDDFHLGEMLLPWQQVISFHKVPFVDYAPIHGVMQLILGLLNWTFYDGTVANMINATIVLQAIGVGVCALSVYYLVGAPLALFCVVMIPSHFFGAPFDRLLFLPAALFCLAHPVLFENRKRWLVIWFLLASFMAIYNPSVGAAFGVSTIPFALWHLIKLYSADRPSCIKLLFGVALVGLLGLAIPQTRDILLGYFSFIFENGATNSVANGIPANQSIGSTPYINGLLSIDAIYEFLRFLWIIFIPFSIFALFRLFSNKIEPLRESQFFLFVCPVIFLIVLSVWSIGRIDPGSTRTAGVSFIVMGQILPVTIAYVFRKRRLQIFVFLALLGGVFGAFYGFQDHFNARLLAQRANAVTIVPESLLKVDGQALGLPNLGNLFAESTRLSEVVGFRDALNEIISEDQTYFDLTNKQAHYFYSNRPVPSLYSAVYVAANINQQSRVLRQLRDNPPAAVFIDPFIDFDGFSSSLRSFYLYREIVQNYNPFRVGDFLFMVNEKSKVYSLAATGLEKRNILSTVFSHFNLRSVATAWGRSWSTLQLQANKVYDLDPMAYSSSLSVKVLPEGKFQTNKLFFDEAYYLKTYPDIAAAVSEGNFSSGHSHYLGYGMKEGRKPNATDDGYPAITYDLNPMNYSGSDIDLIVIGFDQLSETKGLEEVTLSWVADGVSLSQPVRMSIASDYLVVPVSSFPDWILAKHVDSIQLQIPNTVDEISFKIRNLSLWKNNIKPN